MKEAKPITLPRSAVAVKTRHGPIDPIENLYVDTINFRLVCGETPSGATGIADFRYRVLLTVENWPELDGVYYVGGWLDEGLCALERDDTLTRREAVRLKKRGYL